MGTTYDDLKTLSPQPTLAAAGTAQAITSSNLQARSIIIYAAKNNTGNIYIGTDDASAKISTGIVLTPGSPYVIEGDKVHGFSNMVRLASIYFDGANTGDKLVVQYLA